MRAAISASTLALLALAMAGVRATAAPAVCGPEQIGSATVRTWCGPAKARVSWGGKTITIKGGTCDWTNYQGIKAFTVNTGRYTIPPAKPKFTSFSAGGSDRKPGTYKNWLVNFQTPGKQWMLQPTKTIVKITASGGKKGTFSGPLWGSGGAAKGSWTC